MTTATTIRTLHPGRDCQRFGIARYLEQPESSVNYPAWGVIGTLGDSQCYLGVPDKVAAVQAALAEYITDYRVTARLTPTMSATGVSDGSLNGTPEMRYSLISRQYVEEAALIQLEANKVDAAIAIVACDKPPVGVVAALLQHNRPAIVMSDGSIRPGKHPITGEAIDIVTAFQSAGLTDPAERALIAEHACPGFGSCGGMFTYNTMQSFFGALGLEPIKMVAPASDDPRRTGEFASQLPALLDALWVRGITPRRIATASAFRNAVITDMALGGSTNVLLHMVYLAQAAGLNFWTDVMSQQEFNGLSERVPVLINARPFGKYSMVDIEHVGGLQVVMNELLAAGLLDGTCLTCTGDTLTDQLGRLEPNSPDQEVIFSVKNPFKPTGGLRLLSGNLAPDGGAAIKVAGVAGLQDNRFVGRARTFDSEEALITALDENPGSFEDGDMVVIRYIGPRGAPGMPELLDPTSRITALCNQRGIVIGLMTDARFSGGSVGLVIGHVGPEAALGGPIALVQTGDVIVVDLNTNRLDCLALGIMEERDRRHQAWCEELDDTGQHPAVVPVSSRVLQRMRRRATPALSGAIMEP